jgi:hypothetical protein
MGFAFLLKKWLKMKKYFLMIFLLGCLTGSGCTAGYVSNRPADVRYVRPGSPGPGYVWITGDWQWRGGSYHWKEGHWHAARAGQNWKSGYWEKSSKGYRWHKGNWQ